MTIWAPDTRRTMQAELEEVAQSAPGHWGFAVRESGDLIAAVNADDVMVPASTIKVAVLVLTLQEVAAGRLAWGQLLPIADPGQRVGGSGVLVWMPNVTELSIAEIAELMIVVSDNEATNILMRLLGVQTLDRRLAQLGLQHTQLQRTLMDTHLPGRNRTSAADQALLLDLLCGDLLPPEQRQIALDVLGRQQFRSRIPGRIAGQVTVGNKTGSIDGIRHDVAILEFDGRQVVFAALGSDLHDALAADGDNPVDDIVARAAQRVVRLARG